MIQMKDAELKLNASGYYDETCYKGITAPPQPGEIWSNQDGTKYWLVLQVSDKACSTLQLNRVQKGNSITVLAHEPMYTDPIMIGYTYIDLLCSFVRKLKASEYQEVQRRVGNALGITASAAANNEHIQMMLEAKNADLQNMVADLQNRNKELQLELDAKNMADKMVSDAIEDMEREISCLRIYKEMYLTILDKLISAKGGAVSDQAGVF